MLSFYEKVERIRARLEVLHEYIDKHQDAYRSLDELYKSVEGMRVDLIAAENRLATNAARLIELQGKKKDICNYATQLKFMAMGKKGTWMIQCSQINAQYEAAHSACVQAENVCYALTVRIAARSDLLNESEGYASRYREYRRQLDEFGVMLFGFEDTEFPEQDEKREAHEAAQDASVALESQLESEQNAIECLEAAKAMIDEAIEGVDRNWPDPRKTRYGYKQKALEVLMSTLVQVWKARKNIVEAKEQSQWVASLPERGIEYAYAYFQLTFPIPIDDCIQLEDIERGKQEISRCAFGLDQWLGYTKDREQQLRTELCQRKAEAEKAQQSLRYVRDKIVRNALRELKQEEEEEEWGLESLW